MFGRVRLWLWRKLVRNVRDDAVKKLHEAATLLYRIREYNPEMAGRVNEILDYSMYPAIYRVSEWKEEDLCPTSKKTDEQKLTLTLVK